MALRPIGPGTAGSVGGDADGLGVEVLRGEGGQVEFLRLGGRLYPRTCLAAGAEPRPLAGAL